MQLKAFKNEFFHPNTPIYVVERFFEKLCQKPTTHGMNETDVIVFEAVLRHGKQSD